MSQTSDHTTRYLLGFDEPLRAVVIGGRDGIGAAFVRRILEDSPNHMVWSCGRDQTWVESGGQTSRETRVLLDLTSEADWAGLVDRVTRDGAINCVINASGLLHSTRVQPERSWRAINLEMMRAVFDVNTFGLGLAIRHLAPLFERTTRGLFASLSARVGSIEDNRLGGWYSYRASKAAQNMFLKCAALEAKRLWPQLVFAALQPGTVDTALSRPFVRRSSGKTVFSPLVSADHLIAVLAALEGTDSGSFLGWDGDSIPW